MSKNETQSVTCFKLAMIYAFCFSYDSVNIHSNIIQILFLLFKLNSTYSNILENESLRMTTLASIKCGFWQSLQILYFLLVVIISAKNTRNIMETFAFLLISIQKPLTIETLVDFPIAKVFLLLQYESHILLGMVFRKMVSFFLNLLNSNVR